jgi:hypothetical protein
MMRKIIITVTAASLVIAGITVPAVSASAAPGTSPACTAAIQNQKELTFRINVENEEIAQYNQLEAQETADRDELGTLTSLKKTVEHALENVVLNIGAGKLGALGALAEKVAIGLEAADILSLGLYAVEIRSANSSLTDVEDQLNDSFGLTDMANINGLMAELSTANTAVTSACQATTATPTPPAPGSPAPPSGGANQYYDNGLTYAEGVYTDGESQYGIPVGGSVTPQYACTTVESNQGTPANGDSGDVFPQDGTDPYDIGTTEADQAEWFSGCVAGATADLNGTQPQAPTGSPAPAGSSATTPAATDPAPTASPSTGSPATMPSAAPSGTGSTQQYYQNGATFAQDNEGTLAANTEGAVTDAGVSACTAVASSSPGAGMAGDEDTDTGPTAADQAAWISGCAANYTGTGTSTDPTTGPTPTATGSPTPTATYPTTGPTPTATGSPTPTATDPTTGPTPTATGSPNS